MRLFRVAVAACSALLLLCSGVVAEEVMIAMRDGVKLHTFIDFPLNGKKDNLTAVMDRSPYGAWATELVAEIFILFGMAAVRQDFRGTHQSEGNFSLWKEASPDAYDTMQYLTSQPWSDGTVKTVGASADGMAQFFMIKGRPPWLKAQWVIFAGPNGYEMVYPGGAYRQQLIDHWLSKTVPDVAAQRIAEVKRNEAPGQWWSKINDTGAYNDVTWPSVLWGGWYDIFLQGTLVGWTGYQYHSAPAVRGTSKIVIDPLGHCQKGSHWFPRNTLWGRAILPIFLAIDMITETSKFAEHVKAVTFYVMGANEDGAPGNYWTTGDTFPEAQLIPHYLQPNGGLSTSVPVRGSSQSYLYDPKNPVPTVGGGNLFLDCGPADQSALESRQDVLTFTTDPMGSAFALTGPIDATLYVSSDQVDTDFTAKISDVYPDGRSVLIQDGIARMRWRHWKVSNVSQLMNPGQVYQVNMTLWNTSYVFGPGHKLRVAISSSNAPRFNPNPNTGRPISENGTVPVRVAKNTVYFSAQYPSSITLPVVSMSQLPPAQVLTPPAPHDLVHGGKPSHMPRGDRPRMIEGGGPLLGGDGVEHMPHPVGIKDGHLSMEAHMLRELREVFGVCPKPQAQPSRPQQGETMQEAAKRVLTDIRSNFEACGENRWEQVDVQRVRRAVALLIGMRTPVDQ